MENRPIPRMTYFLYAEADFLHKEEIKAHLAKHFNTAQFGYVRYSTIEDFFPLSEKLSTVILDTTSFICLVSPHFLASPFYQSVELKKLITAHYLKNLRFISLELFDVDLKNTFFHSFTPLSTNQNPIYSSAKEVYHHRLTLVTEEIAGEITMANAYMDEMDANWARAQKNNTIDEFEFFLRTYPHSQYSTIATVHLNELKEEKLWKEAQAFDTIKYYLQYLLQTPSNKYEEEAIFKITELEGDDDIAGRDAIDNMNLALLFDYKRRFKKGVHLAEVNDKIFDILSRPIESLRMERPQKLKDGEIFDYFQGLKEEEEGLVLKGSLLNYLVHQKNTPSEIFAFEHLMNFGEDLHKKVKKLKGRLSGFSMSFSFTFVAVPVLIGLLIGTVKWGHFEFGLWIALMLASLIYFLYRSVLAYSVTVREDQKLCEAKLKETKKNLTRLKVAFISHDKMQINKLILFFQNTDSWVNAMNAQTEFNYLFKEKEIEAEPPTLILENL